MNTAIVTSLFVAGLSLVECRVPAQPADRLFGKEYVLNHLTDILDAYRNAENQRLLQQRTTPKFQIEFDSHWPGNTEAQWPYNDLKVGQVGGVAVDNSGDLYVFHRGNRNWNANTFEPFTNKFANPEQGPITNFTIIRVDQHTGRVTEKFGDNKFYLPHGISIDRQGNLWVTDVALHQVMKIPAGSHEPNLTLGEAFVPGSDDSHFCKPTDVAVASNGDFFVADGYCNHRIMKFDKDGKLLRKWGGRAVDDIDRYTLQIPHSLTLLEDRDQICVADREHGRIVCYSAGLHGSETGRAVAVYENPNFGTVYALTHKGGKFYVVNGPDRYGTERPSSLFEVDIDTGKLSETQPPSPGFGQPHDIDISPDGNFIYTGEINPWNRVLRFRRSHA